MNWFKKIANALINWRCLCGQWNPIWRSTCSRCKCVKGATR